MERYCSNPHYRDTFESALFSAIAIGNSKIYECEFLEYNGVGSATGSTVFYFAAEDFDFVEQKEDAASNYYINKVLIKKVHDLKDFLNGEVIYCDDFEWEKELPPTEDPFYLMTESEVAILENYLFAKKQFEDMRENLEKFQIGKNIEYVPNAGIFKRIKND